VNERAHAVEAEIPVSSLSNVADAHRFWRAIKRIDEINERDPRRISVDGKEMGSELYYSMQLTRWILHLDPEPSEALLIAARGQHLLRWEIPRASYPMNRAGYLKWRADLKGFHAQKVSELLEKLGFSEDFRCRVSDLNLKRRLKQDPDCQALEDALCLVFLERQFAGFSAKTDEVKMVGILRKSWGKMSKAGRSAALNIEMGGREKRLLELALGAD